MKKYLVIPMVALTLIALSACDETSKGLTSITYYPVIELNGGSSAQVEVGSTYIDPGFTAMEGEEDVTAGVSVSIMDLYGSPISEIPTSEPGVYRVSYSATNVDGFSAAVSRYVYVYDPAETADIGGLYEVDMPESYFTNANGTYTFQDRYAYYAAGTPMTSISFTQVAPGMYRVEDLFGHWYRDIRGYVSYSPTDYNMSAYVVLTPENKIERLYSNVNAWGDGIDYFEDGLYDSETGDVSYSIGYAGVMSFDLLLHKN